MVVWKKRIDLSVLQYGMSHHNRPILYNVFSVWYFMHFHALSLSLERAEKNSRVGWRWRDTILVRHRGIKSL